VQLLIGGKMISQTVAQILAVGVGIFSVPLASLLKNEQWGTKLKFFVTSLVPLVASLGISIPIELTNAGDIHPGATAATTLAVAQVVYRILFSDTKLENKLANSLVKPKKQAEEE
jgi:hypothetical protein